MGLLHKLKALTAFIYDLFISNFLTIAAHVCMVPHMTLSSGTFLDVGCGTGTPMKKIYPQISQNYKKIIGVDLDEAYTEKAKRLFENNDDVAIYNMDFYDINKVLQRQKYDFILFSFSFMLMPDPIKALQIAINSLNKNGKIAFVMTLYPKEKPWLQRLKPLIYKFTSVDFGKIFYQKQFEEILKITGLKIDKKVRMVSPFNLCLAYYPVYYVEATIRT